MELDNPTEEQLLAYNEETARRLEREKNGVPVVLLVHGDRYAEVVHKEGDDLTLSFWCAYTHRTVQQMQADGYKPVQAYRIFKANGTLVYIVPVEGGQDVYTTGKKYSAVRTK